MPFQSRTPSPDTDTPTATAAAMRAVADTTCLPRELWATVEPCDTHGWVIDPPVDVRITRERLDVAMPSEAADA
jgi:hypothetical protein